ncbi:MAG: hypothetical protein AB7G13_08830 [Lautropia sp.]
MSEVSANDTRPAVAVSGSLTFGPAAPGPDTVAGSGSGNGNGASSRQWSLGSMPVALGVFAAFLLAPLPWIAIYFVPPINHDAAALLHFASRWLAGERLYVDLIDINPPLIFILNLIPAAIDRMTPINGPTALVLCALAWVAVGIWFCIRLLALTPGRAGEIRRYLLLPLLLFLTIVYPGTEFGQRESLMLAAALPYLLLAEARMNRREPPRALLLAVAAFAAIGFALKPHFLLIPLLIETCVLTTIGWRALARDPVPWALATIFLLHVLFIVFVTPRYFDTVVPLAMQQYLSLGGLGPWGVLLRSALTPTAALFIPLAIAALLVQPPLARLAAAGALAGIVIATVQAKGWPYHLLPAETFVMLTAGALLSAAADLFLPVEEVRRRGLQVLLLTTLMLGVYYVSALTRPTFWRQAAFPNSQAGQLIKRFGNQLASGPVLVLSPGLYPHFPVINYTGSTLAMRFMTLWPIQGAYARCTGDRRMFRPPAEMGREERYAFEAIIDDFLRMRPTTVVIDKIPGIPMCSGEDFDFLRYFRQSSRFAQTFDRYRLIGEYDRYRVYARP